MALFDVDYRFVTYSALGRMDMLCAAFGFAALATYVSVRSKSLRRALLYSHALAAAAVMTHPCGILYVTALVLLNLYFDRARFAVALLAPVLSPYFMAIGAWGIYISKAPAMFVQQFGGNISGFAGESGASRVFPLLAPFSAVKQEIASRYLFNFGWTARWDDPVKLQYIMLAVYVIAVLELFAARRFRARGEYKLFGYGAVFFAGMLFLLDGLHEVPYIVHLLPFLVFFVAFMVREVSEHNPRPAAVLTVAIVALQIIPTVSDFRRNRFRNSYLPVITFLRTHWTPSTVVIGPSELAFQLGFGPYLRDDIRLGYFTGVQPDYIVTNELYDRCFEAARRRDPALYGHIRRTLDRSSIVFRNQMFSVYAVKPSLRAARAIPAGAP
jgi:hypothetical protein